MAKPPGEWDLVSCEERHKEEPFFRGVFRAAGTVGKQTDRARCLRIEPRDEPPPADAEEKEARRGMRACRAPARFRD